MLIKSTKEKLKWYRTTNEKKKTQKLEKIQAWLKKWHLENSYQDQRRTGIDVLFNLTININTNISTHNLHTVTWPALVWAIPYYNIAILGANLTNCPQRNREAPQRLTYYAPRHSACFNCAAKITQFQQPVLHLTNSKNHPVQKSYNSSNQPCSSKTLSIPATSPKTLLIPATSP
jgi:exonuclease VII large subunit